MSQDHTEDTGEFEVTEVTSDLSENLGSYNGRMLGPYRIIKEAYRDGFAVGFLATDTRFEKPVTLILTYPEFSKSSTLLHDEALALRELHHPGIRSIVDYRDDGTPTPYLVTEWVGVEGLNTIVRDGPSPLRADLLGIIRDVADTLCYVHSRGFAHRDIKPSNILIDNSTGVPRSKLIGFELAIQVDKVDHDHTIVVGTPRYMSPEQFRGDRIGFSSDVFSLGLVLYETMFGRRDTPSVMNEYLLWHGEVRARLIGDSKSGERETFKGLRALVYRMLSEEPALRPTMAEVKAQLEQILASRAGRSVAVEPAAEMTSTAIGVIMACGLLAMSGASSFQGGLTGGEGFLLGSFISFMLVVVASILELGKSHEAP